MLSNEPTQSYWVVLATAAVAAAVAAMAEEKAVKPAVETIRK